MPLDVPTLPIWFEVLWMTVNCGFGAAVARKRQATVFGTLLSGTLVGLGGGIVRDLLLGLEPAAISTWYYLPAGVVGAVGGALLFQWVIARTTPVLLLQGVTLGFLVSIGVQKAIAYGAPWFSAMALGVVTASFGGMFADVINGERATIARQAHWVPMALCSGALIFWCLTQLVVTSLPASPTVGLWLATIPTVISITTMLTISTHRNWPSMAWPGEPRTAT